MKQMLSPRNNHRNKQVMSKNTIWTRSMSDEVVHSYARVNIIAVLYVRAKVKCQEMKSL